MANNPFWNDPTIPLSRREGLQGDPHIGRRVSDRRNLPKDLDPWSTGSDYHRNPALQAEKVRERVNKRMTRTLHTPHSFPTNIPRPRAHVASNTIQGLRHGGIAAWLRRLLTGFGSGWRGLKFLTPAMKYMLGESDDIFLGRFLKFYEPEIKEAHEKLLSTLKTVNAGKLDKLNRFKGYSGTHADKVKKLIPSLEKDIAEEQFKMAGLQEMVDDLAARPRGMIYLDPDIAKYAPGQGHGLRRTIFHERIHESMNRMHGYTSLKFSNEEQARRIGQFAKVLEESYPGTMDPLIHTEEVLTHAHGVAFLQRRNAAKGHYSGYERLLMDMFRGNMDLLEDFAMRNPINIRGGHGSFKFAENGRVTARGKRPGFLQNLMESLRIKSSSQSQYNIPGTAQSIDKNRGSRKMPKSIG